MDAAAPEPEPDAAAGWSEAAGSGAVRCIASAASGAVLLSGSTNVRVWDARTGANTHTVAMKARTSVKCMALQRARAEGGEALWCGHSDGRISEIVLAEGAEPRLERQFAAHRSAASAVVVTPALEVWTGSSHGTIRCWAIADIAAGAQSDTKLGCPLFKPEFSVELEWQGSRGSDVRCLLHVEAQGAVWSGSSGKGGTHVWDAESHAHLEALDGEAGAHLVCATVVQLPAAAERGGGAGETSVWTGHTNGRVGQWDPKRGATTLTRSWLASAEGRWVTAIQSARDGARCVVWIGFEDGQMFAYDASSAAVLRKCKAHHSGIAAMAIFSAPGSAGGQASARLATASTKGTLRAWDALECVAAGGAAEPAAAARPSLGRGLYGGSEFVEYATPARHAFGRRVSAKDGGGALTQAEANAPVRVDVYMHVYDLGRAEESKAFKALKAINTQALGAFHVAVEIFGWEWSFGWNDDGTTGVFSGLPAKCDMHTYREKVALGFTTLSRVQVDKKLARLEDEWMGDRYDMLDRNCCETTGRSTPSCARARAPDLSRPACAGHFCNVLCHELGVGELPKWVNRAAGAGSAIAGGFETLNVGLKQAFRRNKSVAATSGEDGGSGGGSEPQ